MEKFQHANEEDEELSATPSKSISQNMHAKDPEPIAIISEKRSNRSMQKPRALIRKKKHFSNQAHKLHDDKEEANSKHTAK
jgi:hypothetical protein